MDREIDAVQAREAAAAAERRAEREERRAVFLELAGDESLTPLAREAARRAALALVEPDSISVAEYAFQEFVRDRARYGRWVAEVLALGMRERRAK
jgi:hypothetical protein